MKSPVILRIFKNNQLLEVKQFDQNQIVLGQDAEVQLDLKGEGVSDEFHPIAKAAWQFMRLNIPALVYPGYNVREDLAPVQFVKALVGAIASIAELLAPFDSRAKIKKLAPSVDLSKSCSGRCRSASRLRGFARTSISPGVSKLS